MIALYFVYCILIFSRLRPGKKFCS